MKIADKAGDWLLNRFVPASTAQAAPDCPDFCEGFRYWICGWTRKGCICWKGGLCA